VERDGLGADHLHDLASSSPVLPGSPHVWHKRRAGPVRETTGNAGQAPVPEAAGPERDNHRVKAVAPLMEAALRWLAEATPRSAELLRLMAATPVPCCASEVTARRSGPYGYRRVPGLEIDPDPDVIQAHPRPRLPCGSPQYARRPTGGRAYGLLDVEQGMS